MMQCHKSVCEELGVSLLVGTALAEYTLAPSLQCSHPRPVPYALSGPRRLPLDVQR